MRNLGLLFILVGLGLGAAAASSAPAALPKSIEDMFQEKDDDGHLVLGDADRAALQKLPSNILDQIAKAADDDRVAGAPHLKVLLSLNLTPQTADLVFNDNCVLCHSNPILKKDVLFSPDPKGAGTPTHLNLKSVLSDVHFRRGLMCSGCHGGKATDKEMTAEISERWPDKKVRHDDRTWIPDFCARCHADPAFMRSFNPSLPTDQYAKYKESKHGVLLLQQKDSKAAQCVSCHGVHGIRDPKTRQSTVFAQNIPDTCGHCHADASYMAGYKKEDGSPLPTNQLEQYKKSVHGKALLEKGDLSAPACNSCHGNHAAMPPAVSSVSQVCRTCHAQNGTLFDGSKHKVAFEKHGWPECEKCHGKHDISQPSDSLISDSKDALCGSCHAQNAADNKNCNSTAKYFRETLDSLTVSAASYPPVIEHLAERGLDPDPITAATSELDEAIQQTRTRVHTFDKGGFDIAAVTGRQAVEKTDALIAAAHAEHRFRRNGLLVAIAAMGFLAVLMALKIREIAARRNQGGG
jgi:predicted CXXCH cytochrome family protein